MFSALADGRVNHDIVVQNHNTVGAKAIDIVGFTLQGGAAGAHGARNGHGVVAAAMDGQRVGVIRQRNQLGLRDGQVGLFGKLQIDGVDVVIAKAAVAQIDRGIGALVVQNHIGAARVARRILRGHDQMRAIRHFRLELEVCLAQHVDIDLRGQHFGDGAVAIYLCDAQFTIAQLGRDAAHAVAIAGIAGNDRPFGGFGVNAQRIADGVGVAHRIGGHHGDIGVIGAVWNDAGWNFQGPVAACIHHSRQNRAVEINHNGRSRLDLTAEVDALTGLGGIGYIVARSAVGNIKLVDQRIDTHRVRHGGHVARNVCGCDRNVGDIFAAGHLVRAKGRLPVAIGVHDRLHGRRAQRHHNGRSRLGRAGDNDAVTGLVARDDVVAFDYISRNRQVIHPGIDHDRVGRGGRVARRVRCGRRDIRLIGARRNFSSAIKRLPHTGRVRDRLMGHTAHGHTDQRTGIGIARQQHTIAGLCFVDHIVTLDGAVDGQKAGLRVNLNRLGHRARVARRIGRRGGQIGGIGARRDLVAAKGGGPASVSRHSGHRGRVAQLDNNGRSRFGHTGHRKARACFGRIDHTVSAARSRRDAQRIDQRVHFDRAGGR
mmetsp:Transcript_23307/g.40436  ORF Transcript_23307/g.40436 Transcript_23307/m.40436 type:complete len:598 (-) Transcript_23307:2180-3973(-)